MGVNQIEDNSMEAIDQNLSKLADSEIATDIGVDANIYAQLTGKGNSKDRLRKGKKRRKPKSRKPCKGDKCKHLKAKTEKKKCKGNKCNHGGKAGKRTKK